MSIPDDFRGSRPGGVFDLPEPRKAINVAPSKYHRGIKFKIDHEGVQFDLTLWIDIYDVLKAYEVTNPADAHAIKKMLMPGQRGVKGANQDREEAIVSLRRAIELEAGDGNDV